MMIGLPHGLLIAISFAPPSERGAQDRPQAPIGLEFADSIPAHERGEIERSFAEALPRACDPAPCTDDCSDDQPTLGIEIGGNTRNYTLHWVADDPRRDDPLVLDSRCELCSLVELEAQLAAELGRVCAQLDAIHAAPGLVELTSDPPGAKLRIDGRNVGRTPWSGELAAGEHRIVLRASHHRPGRRTFVVVAGERGHEHLTLLDAGLDQRPFWPGWTGLGLGLALSIAGTALIAVDGQPWAGRCDGADVDVRGNCRFSLTTRPLGIGLAAAGAGALATGIGLMIWAQVGARAEAPTTAGVAIGGRI